jgi:BolA protein
MLLRSAAHKGQRRLDYSSSKKLKSLAHGGNSMRVEERIKEKLTEAFSPTRLVVENDSHKHAGHAAMKGLERNGETHFTVTVVSERFAGRGRIERHRMVHEALAEELAGPVHALAVKAKTPDEAADGG